MKKGLLWLGLVLAMILTIGACDIAKASDSDNEVSYSIPSYKGHLAIHEDGGATFTQEVTYDFSSSYNGQYVTLGSVKPLPKGFNIEENPTVTVSDKAEKITTENGVETVFTKRQIRVESEKLKDGIKLKVYNPGAYDKVVLKVTWQIKHMLDLYSDVAVLNWFPISDWDKSIGHVDFTVDGLDSNKGELYAHAGFFQKNPQVQRTDEGYNIQFDHFPAKGKLELHAYWPMTPSLKSKNSASIINSSAKDKFLKQENDIVRNRKIYHIIFYGFFPGLLLVLFVLAIVFYSSVLRSTRPPRFPKDSRLYDIPQNLAPLVLAQNVYNQRFDISGLNSVTYPISFNHMVQATILDLIDRGNLSFNQSTGEPILEFVKSDGLADFEVAFIDMLFDGQSQVKEKDMFSRYYINKDEIESQYKKAKNRTERDKLRSIGRNIRSLFLEDATRVTQGVENQEKKLGLPSLYRQLTPSETHLSSVANIMFISLYVLIAIGFFLLSIGFSSNLSFLYLLIFFPVITIHFIYRLQINGRVKGCLVPENSDIYYQWHSFNNMIKSIGQFNQAELQSIVLWNRILVYATLYGQAKKVSDVLKRYNIHLSNPSLDAFTYSPVSFAMLHNSTALQSYVSASDTVSNFSINSSSGSGGFSGGGFSGGGGGGGGGAF
ncbi:DUF2207 domain-containing protein [Streptococcus salivarius]|uniref:DUF2207 domain-containing protein n=1 Tax=Streptococcus salivarius TaxID=1304 RepID=UPI001B7D3B4A|nr:DUF2207 domain-containing protein [Streptococcus salivarius]